MRVTGYIVTPVFVFVGVSVALQIIGAAEAGREFTAKVVVGGHCTAIGNSCHGMVDDALLCARELVTRHRPIDPWLNPYQVAGDRLALTVWSVGPDGISGTRDDIVRTTPDCSSPDNGTRYTPPAKP